MDNTTQNTKDMEQSPEQQRIKEVEGRLENVISRQKRDSADIWEAIGALQNLGQTLKTSQLANSDFERKVKDLELDFAKMRSLLIEKSSVTQKEKPSAMARRMIGGFKR